jgi:hypothetical protein
LPIAIRVGEAVGQDGSDCAQYQDSRRHEEAWVDGECLGEARLRTRERREIASGRRGCERVCRDEGCVREKEFGT